MEYHKIFTNNPTSRFTRLCQAIGCSENYNTNDIRKPFRAPWILLRVGDAVMTYLEARYHETRAQPPHNQVERWFRAQQDYQYLPSALNTARYIARHEGGMDYMHALTAEVEHYLQLQTEDNVRFNRVIAQDDATRFTEVFLSVFRRVPVRYGLPEQSGAEETPYFVQESGDLVLYKETFQDHSNTFWRTRPWWARNVGFLVTVKNPFQSQEWRYYDLFRFVTHKSPRIEFLIPTLPPEILILIVEQALEGGDLSTLLASRPLLQRRREALFKDVVCSRPINAVDTPKYAALVAEYAAKVSLNIGYGFPPGWIQRFMLLFAASKRRLHCAYQEPDFTVTIDLSHALPAQACRYRSIFTPSPRPPPPSCSKHIQKLVLSNYCFYCFSDLLHLVWELPSIQTLECRNLSWKQCRIGQSFVPRRQLCNTFSVSAQGCRDAAPLVFLLTSVFQIQTTEVKGALTGPHGWALVALVRAAMKSPVEDKYVIWTFRRIGCLCEVRNDWPYKPKIYMNSVRFILDQSPTGNPQVLCVLEINLVLFKAFPNSEIDWEVVNQEAIQFLDDPTQKLVINFVENKGWVSLLPEAVYAVHEVFASRFPDLWASDQVELRRGKMMDTHMGGLQPALCDLQPFE